MTNVNAETGILLDVLTEIGKFETNDCCLVIDSMSIKKEIHWDRANNRFVIFLLVYLKQLFITRTKINLITFKNFNYPDMLDIAIMAIIFQLKIVKVQQLKC